MQDRPMLELEEYIRQGEPGQADRSAAWKTAIGLQDVDGLKTSDYLLETAKEHIEGKIDIKSAQKRIESYYEERSDRRNIEADTKEADIVSARIAELLSEKTFQFSPAELASIHRRLFSGVFKHAGQFRTYNIMLSGCHTGCCDRRFGYGISGTSGEKLFGSCKAWLSGSGADDVKSVRA